MVGYFNIFCFYIFNIPLAERGWNLLESSDLQVVLYLAFLVNQVEEIAS